MTLQFENFRSGDINTTDFNEIYSQELQSLGRFGGRDGTKVSSPRRPLVALAVLLDALVTFGAMAPSRPAINRIGLQLLGAISFLCALHNGGNFSQSTLTTPDLTGCIF